MDYPLETFFTPCPRGLEPVLCQELQELGAQQIEPTQGGAGFRGPLSLCYRVNLESRLASRVLWKVFSGPYENEKDIYHAVYSLPWPEWFSVDRTIKVRIAAQRCPLKSLDFVTLRIKDAVCDAFAKKKASRPNVDTRTPDVQIFAFLNEKTQTLYLDTSGEPLFKRGWRHMKTVAPLRENLAAGILRLTGWTPEEALLDPMCGGGTFLVEAAQMAKGIAPGLGRIFAFQKLRNFDATRWAAICEGSRKRQKPSAQHALFGYDLDDKALMATRKNLEAAGVAEVVVLKQVDILTMEPPAHEGVLVTNPPYGHRLGDPDDLARFYPRLGDQLKQKFFGWRAYLLTEDQRLPKLIRLAPSQKTPLYNGALECRLYEFKLVSGGNRKIRRINKELSGGKDKLDEPEPKMAEGRDGEE